MRAVPLHRRLLLLAAAAILPLALMSGIALQALLSQQRQQAEQSGLDLSRALATAIDTELRLSISVLETLSATESLGSVDAADTDGWYRLSQRVLAARPEWIALALADGSGQLLFSTNLPLHSTLPSIADKASFDEVVRTRVPVVGSLTRGPLGHVGVPIRVPVLRGDRPPRVLTAVVKPEAIVEVISRQHVPADWVVSVYDAGNHRIARSRNQAKFIGTPPSPSLLELERGGTAEAVGITQTLEGERVLTAYNRLPSFGWSVALGVPASIIDAALHHSAVAYGGGILLSLAVGSLAALLVARSIADPIARLREAASAIGRGEVPVLPDTPVTEVRAVGRALLDAAELRRRDATEREALLASERETRDAADRARNRLQLLVDAGDAVARALDEQTVLQALAEVVVPTLADWCRIDLTGPDGSLRRMLTHHRDPAKASAVDALIRELRPASGAAGSMARSVQSGEMQRERFNRPGDYGDITDPALLAFAKAIGMRGYCVVPLVARGRKLGAMAAIQAESNRVFSDEDCSLINELAHRAALALDNGRLYTESEAALREAGVASRAKDDFLAMLGHELRNPLAPIVSSLELLARREPGTAAPERRIIERQVAHLSRLVDDLLDVSRIASGKIHLSLERVDLRTVVERALELAEPALQTRSQRPEITLPAAPVWVCADPVRLAQVVCNLLTNAAKFATPSDRIAVTLERSADGARLSVEDNGIGIPAGLLERIFDRFVQGEQALQRASGGLGLGLAIARELVELHGGTIRAESEGPERGSRFVVTVPVVEPNEEVPPPAAQAAPAAPSRLRVLVVDDNVDASEALAELLGFEGHDVRIAGNAERALEVLEGFDADVALLDIGLPGMDGFELARVLRRDPRRAKLRLIALTGYGREPDRRRAFDAGFDQHMVKPVDIELLLAHLRAC